MTFQKDVGRVVIAALLCWIPVAHAQTTLATVNGVVVPTVLLEQVIKNNAQQDIRDTPEMRQVIRDELILREILSQEAIKRGLDKAPEAQTQWRLLRQNFLAELLLADFLKKNPISPSEVRKEYERQVGALTGSKQYRLSSVVLGSEAEAKVALERLQKGEPFETVARDVSIDASRYQGGDLGWLLADQVVPLISNVMVNLPVGATVAAPIQTPTGWHLIRLADKRDYVAPSFNEANEQVRQGLVQQKRLQFIHQLQSQAKVETTP